MSVTPAKGYKQNVLDNHIADAPEIVNTDDLHYVFYYHDSVVDSGIQLWRYKVYDQDMYTVHKGYGFVSKEDAIEDCKRAFTKLGWHYE